MRLKYVSLIVLVIVFFKVTETYSQNLKDLSGKESDTLIIWTKDRKLNWSDFQSKKGTINFEGAQSATSTMLIPFLSKDNIYYYKILAGFFKNKSWVDSVYTEDFILKHEQIHFDIAELFARKMRKEVNNLKLKDEILLPADYRLIHDKFYILYKDYQNEYDLETDHAKIYKMQKKWEEKVAKELDELEEYSLKGIDCKSNN